MADPPRSASTHFSAGSEGAAETISQLCYCFGAKCNDYQFSTCELIFRDIQLILSIYKCYYGVKENAIGF
jgi:hypothetical protein